ncbi:dUMP phosphatase [Paenibacillus sp. J31TS4]|uniref:HAD family hydrolase n=1 Tax=Paenibacillus sp. J31TS4 TaxID=2807195 RepID=UPI001B2D2457|nr:HAD family hydrolase [Paenibacillus sp. J31TS4]GIP39418.1 dUMP phosphatase [Paenibacillus sp. J31TS4]
MKRRWKVVLFDLDDTLLHFDDYWQDSMLETFRQHPSTAGRDPGPLFEQLCRFNEHYVSLYHNQAITLRQFRNERVIETLRSFAIAMDEAEADRFNELHNAISRSFMRANPALLGQLTAWRRSYALGIVTNGTASWQQDKIRALGIEPLFPASCVVVSEDAGCEKPDPEIYRRALACFGVSPEEALFVGDSWKNDVQGPMKAGMQAVWYNRLGEALPEGEHEPYAVISRLDELDAIL